MEKIMTVHETITRRRSIRDFLDTPIEKDKLMLCLEAARLAPSASNSQPWKFIVVNDKTLKNNLCDVAFGGLYRFNSFCKTAPVIVVLIAEQSKFITRIGGLIKDIKYNLVDIGIAGEHFVLQAEELGLGTCWIGWFNEKGVKATLAIPEKKRVAMLIAAGYSRQDEISTKQIREPVERIVSFNTY
jgi:nitroreductase